MNYNKAVLVDSNIIISSFDLLHTDYKKAIELLTKSQNLNLIPVITDLILSEVSTYFIHHSMYAELQGFISSVQKGEIELVCFDFGILSSVMSMIHEKKNKHVSFCDYYSLYLIKENDRYYKNGILSLDEHFKGSRLFVDLN